MPATYVTALLPDPKTNGTVDVVRSTLRRSLGDRKRAGKGMVTKEQCPVAQVSHVLECATVCVYECAPLCMWSPKCVPRCPTVHRWHLEHRAEDGHYWAVSSSSRPGTM